MRVDSPLLPFVASGSNRSLEGRGEEKGKTEPTKEQEQDEEKEEEKVSDPSHSFRADSLPPDVVRSP